MCSSGKGNLQMIKKLRILYYFFLQISTIFVSFSQAHARTLQNHSISLCTTTVQNNTVESGYATIWSMKFSGNPHNYCCFT
jgi:hypothetical protein